VTLQLKALHSRFGRRLLLLFVGCALVPIGVVAFVSYRHVSRHLLAQSEARLRQANLALGSAVFERLMLLDATLKSIPPQAIIQLTTGRRPAGGGQRAGPPPKRDRPSADGGLAPRGATGISAPRPAAAPPTSGEREASRTLVAGVDLLAKRRFVALEFVGDDRSRAAIFGTLDALPPVSPADSGELRLGLPLVTTRHGQGVATRIYLVRRFDRRGIRGHLVGEVSPGFLWGTLDQSMPSAATRVMVVDDSAHVLFRSTPATQALQDDLIPRPALEVGDSLPADAPLVLVSRPLVLDEVFAAPQWRLVLGQSRDEVLGPMVPFTHTFLLVVLISVAAVLLISVHQIRRSLRPMHALQEGAGRIAQRDFASRVAIRSGDEFEELGASFNAMAAQIDRQFQALATAAEIDRAVLSATDASDIVNTLLARIRDVYSCDMVSVTLAVADGTKSLPCVVHEYADDRRAQVRVDLRSTDVQDLLDGPEALVYDPDDLDTPSYLAPLVQRGARCLFVLPLRFHRQLVGVIALGDNGGSLPHADDRVQVRRLADQAAVALANAGMLQQVRTLAFFDSLTGLPNRLSYKERLNRALLHASRTGRRVAAFFIDLDHFSRINDTLGHEAGDQLLQQVATRLRVSCREREDEVGPAAEAMDPEVARLGGDEFTVIMPGIADPADAGKLARRILSSLAHPIRLDGHEVFINASIGIAMYPEDGEDIDSLLMHADTAMYKAKEQGGGSYQTYSRSMNATALQRLTLENALRRALDREEFEVHYQPIVEARSGVPVAAEALVRWRHPELGLLLPSEFVPLAEENGLIVPLGEWVMRTACAQNKAWQEMGLAPIRVVANISSRQLARELTTTVSRILQETGLEARYLGLELTESVLVNHQKEGTETLHALRAMGLHLSVDDFGTGYSSFGYLKHFPLDTLKIDRTFVREIATDPDDAAITTAIIAMGHALGLKVVAEGVETEAHQALLRKQGCDEMQGYLFSRPMPAARFEEFLVAEAARQRPSRRSRSAALSG
jgi:diguanylate cyclase (GGDEF)-like protein